jgi:hypothetical protein
MHGKPNPTLCVGPAAVLLSPMDDKRFCEGVDPHQFAFENFGEQAAMIPVVSFFAGFLSPLDGQAHDDLEHRRPLTLVGVGLFNF